MFLISIHTDNDAFCDDNVGREIARILREIAKTMDNWNGRNPHQVDMRVRDINGNTVGEVSGTR